MSTRQMELSVLAVGGQFAGYRVEAMLGPRSGIGRVYEATGIDSGERVALKVFKGREMGEPAAREHFTRTLEAHARLSHPNVVSVHEWGNDPAPYMVMSLVRGTTLARLLADDAVTGDRALKILAGVAAALDAGRERGPGLSPPAARGDPDWRRRLPAAWRLRRRTRERVRRS